MENYANEVGLDISEKQSILAELGLIILATVFVLKLFLSKPSHSTLLQKSSQPFQSDSSIAQETCDLFSGEWIPSPSGPVYTNNTCKHIEAHQNCITNGRPDSGYRFWKWSPKNCALPQFNAQTFLGMMRNKTWALIGDSISPNHVQSLVCTLSQVEEAVFFYHDVDYRSKGWRFPSYNLTMYVIWSPFLTKAAVYEDINGVSSCELELHLDKLDP